MYAMYEQLECLLKLEGLPEPARSAALDKFWQDILDKLERLRKEFGRG